jgi:hypothetical protein
MKIKNWLCIAHYLVAEIHDISPDDIEDTGFEYVPILNIPREWIIESTGFALKEGSILNNNTGYQDKYGFKI